MGFAEILLNHQQVRGDPEPEPPGRMRRESRRLLHAIFYSIIWIEHILQSEESQIRGVLGSSVTLPCTYSSDVLYTTCWGQGICTWLGCNGELFPQFVATSTISPGLSSKYELRGDLQKGNVSLTIKDLEKTDEGVYCCRIMVTGPGNDLKTVLNLIAVSPPDETTVSCGTIEATTEQPTKAPWQVSFPFKHQVDAAVIQDIVNETRSFKEKACNKSAAGGPDKKDTQAPLPDIVKKTQRFMDKACNSSDAGIAMEALSNFSQSVLASPKEWGRLEKKQQQAALGHLLQAMEVAIADAALNLLRNNKTRYSSPTIVVDMASLQKDKVTERSIISLNANNSVLVARSLSLLGQDDHENTLLTFLAYGHLETVVEPMLAQEGGRNVANVKFNSKVVTVTKVGGQRQGLTATLNITFSVKEEPGDDGKRKRLCGTWMGNGWTTQQESSSNKTHATCVYNTLSSFALLLAQYKMKDPVHSTTLWWITLLVLPVSLLLLLLSVATFFWCRAIRGPYTLIRAHLCLNLFLAELLLLITMFNKGPSMVCALVVGSLHYLLLVAFSWMLLEAVHLWLMVLNLKVVNFTRTRVMKRRYMYPAAYLCPALVVAVAASVNPDGYWRHDGCWLSLEKGFIWSLLGPVCFVVLVNTVLFVMIIWILRNSMTALNADVSTIKDSRIQTFKAMAQFVVLGCSWVVGLFQLNEDTIVLSYIFTIVNSAQGVFIFLVHCLLNQQVRREYSNWFNRMCRRKKAEAADTSSPIVISQVTVSKTVDSQTTQSDIPWVNMGSEG